MPSRIIMIKAGSGSGSAERTELRASLIYFVEVDDPANEGLIAAGQAPGLPRYGSEYRWGTEINTLLRCKSIAAKQSGIRLWEFTCSYSSNLEDQSGQDPKDSGNDLQNPLLQPPDIDWDGEEYQKEIEADVKGNAVVMPNGQRPASPLMVPRSRGVLRITRNEAVFDQAVVEAYADTTNSETFYGAEPGTCVMKRPKAQAHFGGGMAYWRVSWTVHFHGEPVAEKKLAEGSYYFPGGIGVGQKTLFRDQFGQPTGQNQPLKADGDKLSDADIKAGNFEYVTFYPFEEIDWSELQLDYSRTSGIKVTLDGDNVIIG